MLTLSLAKVKVKVKIAAQANKIGLADNSNIIAPGAFGGNYWLHCLLTSLADRR